MFSSLKSIFDGCNIISEFGSLHYISETPDTSANHIINYYLIQGLEDKNICFISLQNTWTHYCAIANKFGINLKNKVADNTIRILDLSKELVDIIFNKISDRETNIFSRSEDVNETLKKLYDYIKFQVSLLNKSDKNFIVIIDSLMPLINLYCDINIIDIFIQYCLQLIKTKGFLVVSSSVDINDKDSLILSHLMLRKCSVSLSVKGLSSGVSNNIHGEMTIRKFPKTLSDINVKEKVFQYKIEERDVNVFERGLSSNIL